MPNSAIGGAGNCRVRIALRPFATILFALCVLSVCGGAIAAAAQDAKPVAAPTAPSAGKALICIYRTSRFVGSAAHDNLYVNDVPLATLLNGEYACTEVAPGTVVVIGLPKMYYGGIIQSSGAALNQARSKENERIRFDAEADKAYYLKWTSGTMATDIKVTQVDAPTATKEMKKLHPSKPPQATPNQN